ncbi:hypothetical protein [Kocuria sp. CPCC 205263]|uniref:hypothetical protein n=1 Tax=Kocuria sp. CPCC 205263 TaxID=3073555 RepID=UPI0034D3ACAA
MAAEPVARQTEPVLVPFGASTVPPARGRGEAGSWARRAPGSRSRPRRPVR